MSTSSSETRALYAELAPGDLIEVEHLVAVGQNNWTTTTSGKVVHTERRRHGLHHRRNTDDKVFSDIILLELADGELTTLTVDEFTVVRRA